MHVRLMLLFAVLPAAIGMAPLSAGVPVRLTGNTGADAPLQKDVVQTITYYGAAFNCPAPTDIRASILNSSMIPNSLRKPSLHASFEEWDATFCGKTHRFFVSYWPDPKGGSFVSVGYPYPAGVPSGVFP